MKPSKASTVETLWGPSPLEGAEFQMSFPNGPRNNGVGMSGNLTQ